MFTPMDMDKVRTWQEQALKLREHGLSIRKIARAVGKCFSQVQRVVTPGAHDKEMQRKKERELEKRLTDPAYSEMTRTYRRKYYQAVAPKKWKSVINGH